MLSKMEVEAEARLIKAEKEEAQEALLKLQQEELRV